MRNTCREKRFHSNYSKASFRIFCLVFCIVLKKEPFLKTKLYNLISSRAKIGTKVPIYSCTENNIEAKKKIKSLLAKIPVAAKYKDAYENSFCFFCIFLIE